MAIPELEVKGLNPFGPPGGGGGGGGGRRGGGRGAGGRGRGGKGREGKGTAPGWGRSVSLRVGTLELHDPSLGSCEPEEDGKGRQSGGISTIFSLDPCQSSSPLWRV